MLANTGAFAGKTIFVSGGSRGIGKAIALKIAKDGANVVIAAKTTEPHPKLEGTIFTAAKEVEAAGGKCLPVQCNLQSEEDIKVALDKAAQQFGSIDILVNNASAISITGTEDTEMKKYDLMHSINSRGTFMASKYAIPYLKKASNGHILNISPPLVMQPIWFSNHVAYTMAKYGMSMCVLGMAAELKNQGIAVNALWPRTAIWTAAMAMLGGENDQVSQKCRTTDIMADSAYAILSKDAKSITGNFFIDEEVLRSEGVTDFDAYAVSKGNKLLGDFFLPDHLKEGLDMLGGISNSAPAQESSSDSSSGSQDASANEESLGEGPAAKIFQVAREMIDEKIKNEINSVLVFVISGKNYLVDAHKSRPLRIALVSELPKSDVTLITDEATFTKMSTGKTKPTNAFMSGKLKVKGNIAVAMKAEKMFKAMKDKIPKDIL